ncbi:MAG: response regulator [Bacteroidota bacterium]|nr:response regulator [Bacteroidota bacterium]
MFILSANLYNKRNISVIVAATILLIFLANFFYYRSLYNKQLDYIVKLLDRQVQIAGLSVDNTNNGFASDLNQIIFTEDISLFFSDQQHRTSAVEKMKLFFQKYEDLVTGIKLYDNNRNEFTLKRDETGNNWLEQTFILHVQGEIVTPERLVTEKKNIQYYLPVIKSDVPVGNIVVSLDFQKYFDNIFTAFRFPDSQWEWVVSDSGRIIYSNSEERIEYSQMQKITSGVGRGYSGSIVHRAKGNRDPMELISSYYSTQLLLQNIGIVFSSPTDKIQGFIFRKSLIVGIVTFILIMALAAFFIRFIRLQEKEIGRLGESEEILFKMIEEMPVGVIIHNKDRKILKANRKAAEQYGYSGEKEMTGIIFPEFSVTDENSYFSRNLGGIFSPDQFVIIRKEIGELILLRTSTPVRFNSEESTMEMLIDVTSLESARKQEARASTAKSEYLTRVSYEIRTPLNGIIGMTDLLDKKSLHGEAKEIVGLLRGSAEALMSIVNDILEFSRIESGKMILDEIPFGLREELDYCRDLARTKINGKKVNLNLIIDENVPDRIIGDQLKFRQMLTNFLNHSARNTAEGQIKLNCNLKEATKDLVRLKFEIMDTGKSFDRETLGNIFGDYVNVESKVHQEDDESGFGPILARQLVELMGGEFSAESPSGLDGVKGKKLVFTISVYPDEKPKKDIHFTRKSNFDQIRVLVITGSQAHDEEILGMLHKLGLAITVTTFQKSTVSHIRTSLNYPENRYQLIIILDDERFNGLDPAREIWEGNLSGEFRIAMISSNDRKGNLLKCNNLGIDHYVARPYDIKDLYNILDESFPLPANIANAESPEYSAGNIRILIIEDNKMNQKVLGTMLKSLGYSFDFADDGFAGYIQAKTRRYDVIFMDLIMPEMDGFESARKILEYDKTSIIVAFTADNMPESKRKAELSGIREFISKPVRIEDLKKLFAKYFIKNQA